jgi:hypothetical protein
LLRRVGPTREFLPDSLKKGNIRLTQTASKTAAVVERWMAPDE